MNSKHFIKLICALLILNSCIGTDVIEDTIEPTLRIKNSINKLIISDTYFFQNSYLNNIGTEEEINTFWTSSDETVISINEITGEATALKTGTSTITSTTNSTSLILTDAITVEVVVPELVINNPISILSINESFTFEFDQNKLGSTTTVVWSSSDTSIINITSTTGIVTTTEKEGTAIIKATTNNTVPLIFEITIEVKKGTFKINNPITNLEEGSSHNFTTLYTDANGDIKTPSIAWSSSDNSILTVNISGTVTAIKKGTAIITATTTNTTNNPQVEITVTEALSKSGLIVTTSSYLLEGNFTLEELTTETVLNLDTNYKATTALPGLYVYLGNNPNTISNAYEIGAVTTFNGAHSYSLPNTIKLEDYKYVLYWCKPFGVKVGEGEIK